jgi:hypothetical protein
VDNNKIKSESGAVVVEAAISLSTFMFLIVTLLSIVNICIVQARIGVALNETAEEVSEYLYIYGLTGINEIQEKLYSDSSDTASQISDLETALTDGIKSIQEFGSGGSDLSDTIDEVQEDGSNFMSVVEQISNTEDKSAWVKSLIKAGENELFEAGKGYACGAIVKGLMVKHLTGGSDTSCDANLKHMGVVNGLSGLNLNRSSFYTNGTEDVTLICSYDVKLLTLLRKDIKFHFVQCAKTKAWGAQALVHRKDADSTDGVVEGDKVVLVGAGEGEEFGTYAAKAKPVDGYVDVIIHASDDGKMMVYANGDWVRFTSNNLASYLESRGLGGQNIRLISCGAGAVDSGIANSVADKLNVNVLAPTDTVWAYPDGTLVVGPDAATDTGEWVVVEPGSYSKKQGN